MTPRGTSDVTLTAWLGGDDGGAMAYEVAQRLARRARESGSLVLVSSAWRWFRTPPWDQTTHPNRRCWS